MRNKRALLPIAVCLCLWIAAAEAADMRIQAAEQGKVTVQGDVINAGGDVTYGLNEEKLNAMLEQREDRLVQKLLAASGDKKERRLLEIKLKTVQEQKADLKKALKKQIQRRKNMDEALTKLHGQRPLARLEEAGKLLQKGDTTAAEQIFEEVVNT